MAGAQSSSRLGFFYSLGPLRGVPRYGGIPRKWRNEPGPKTFQLLVGFVPWGQANAETGVGAG